LVFRLLPEGRPYNRIGLWCVAQALEEGPHIEPCATHYQGKAAVSIEALDLIDSLTAIQSCIKRFIGIDEINQPMGNTLALLWNWLFLILLMIVFVLLRLRQEEMRRDIDGLRRLAHA